MTGKDVFLSEELLSALEHRPGMQNPLDLRVDFTKRLLEGFDEVKLILVVRRQDRFIASHYNQQVKRGETREFGEVFNELPLDNYRWDLLAEAWAQACGDDNLSVIPFESSVLSGGNYAVNPGAANVVTAVCKEIGVPLEIETDGLPVVNASLPPDVLPAQREINETFPGPVADRIADLLARDTEKVPGAALGLFSPDARQRLLDRYADSNRRLFDKYIPRCSVDEYLNA